MRNKWLYLMLVCFIFVVTGCNSNEGKTERKTGVALMEELGIYMDFEKEKEVKVGEEFELEVLVENRSVNDYPYVGVSGCDIGLEYRFSEELKEFYQVKQKIENGVETTGAICTQALVEKVFKPGEVVQLGLILEPIKQLPADFDNSRKNLAIEWDFGGHRVNTKIIILH